MSRFEQNEKGTGDGLNGLLQPQTVKSREGGFNLSRGKTGLRPVPRPLSTLLLRLILKGECDG